jgi:RecB family exonuclease
MRRPISFSQGNNFHRCPFRYHAETVTKQYKMPQAPVLLHGSFLHRVNELYSKHLLHSKSESDYAVMPDIFEEAWKDRASDKQLKLITANDRQELLELAKNMAERMAGFPHEHVQGIELQLGFDKGWNPCGYWDKKKVWFRMKVDRLEIRGGDAKVWDLKTGFKVDASEQKLQVAIYGVGVMAAFPAVNSVSAELEYLRPGWSKVFEVTDDDLEMAAKWAIETSDAIEECIKTNTWPATSGAACADCPVYAANSCPIQAEVPPAMIAPKTQEEAEELLGRLLMNQRDGKSITEALKVWALGHGAVHKGGKTIKFRDKRTPSWDTDGLMRRLKTAGFEPAPYLAFSSKKLKKAPEVVQELADSFKVESVSSEFKVGNTKATD